MQRLWIGESPGEGVESVEGAGGGVVVSGAEVLETGELVGALAVVEVSGEGGGEVKADGEAVGVDQGPRGPDGPTMDELSWALWENHRCYPVVGFAGRLLLRATPTIFRRCR